MTITIVCISTRIQTIAREQHDAYEQHSMLSQPPEVDKSMLFYTWKRSTLAKKKSDDKNLV